MASPAVNDSKQVAMVQQLSRRLQQCWDVDLNRELFPSRLKEVSDIVLVIL